MDISDFLKSRTLKVGKRDRFLAMSVDQREHLKTSRHFSLENLGSKEHELL